MDESITRALTMGVGFMLFVAALSSFLNMYSHMMTSIEIGKSNGLLDQQISQISMETGERLMSKSEVYFMIRNEALIKVYIDSVEYPVALSYAGKQSLQQALIAQTYSHYSCQYMVDDNGLIIEIHLRGN